MDYQIGDLLFLEKVSAWKTPKPSGFIAKITDKYCTIIDIEGEWVKVLLQSPHPRWDTGEVAQIVWVRYIDETWAMRKVQSGI